MQPAGSFYGAPAMPMQYMAHPAQAHPSQYGAMAYSGQATPQMYSGMATPMQAVMSAHATPRGGRPGFSDEVPEDLGYWEERIHPEYKDQRFFYNPTTGVSTYDMPTWVDATDPSTGLVYYFNTVTRVSTYDKPSDFIPIKRLPRTQEGGGDVEDAMGAVHAPAAVSARSGYASARGSRHASRPTSGMTSRHGASRGSARSGAVLQPKAVAQAAQMDVADGDRIEYATARLAA